MKNFSPWRPYTMCDDRVLGTRKEALGINVLSHFWHQKPTSVMGWAGVTSKRRRRPWSSLRRGWKSTQLCTSISWVRRLCPGLSWSTRAPWVELEYGGTPVIFQQDGAGLPPIPQTSLKVSVKPFFWGSGPRSSGHSLCQTWMSWTSASSPFWRGEHGLNA